MARNETFRKRYGSKPEKETLLEDSEWTRTGNAKPRGVNGRRDNLRLANSMITRRGSLSDCFTFHERGSRVDYNNVRLRANRENYRLRGL